MNNAAIHVLILNIIVRINRFLNFILKFQNVVSNWIYINCITWNKSWINFLQFPVSLQNVYVPGSPHLSVLCRSKQIFVSSLKALILTSSNQWSVVIYRVYPLYPHFLSPFLSFISDKSLMINIGNIWH